MPTRATRRVALLFTDIEGSSPLWEQHGDQMMAAVEAHNAVLRELCERHGGTVVKEEGDAFFMVCDTVADAVRLALDAQETLAGCDWSAWLEQPLQVRIGVHSGEVIELDGDYYGPEVNRAARVSAAAHGGQVVVSEAALQAAGELGSEVVVTDLARHRLKGIAEPVRLYQVTRAAWPRQEWPPLASLDGVPTNLPASVTSFVGRERELDELAGHLQAPDTRLVTVVGPGGAGKTRLALQTAGAQMEHFADGVFWVELADVRDPAGVPAAILDRLKLQAPPGQSPTERIAAWLADRCALLVLDNFEQVVDAADTVGELLRAAPRLKLLVTSREVLRLAGEQVYELSPLPLPTPPIVWERLSQLESVRLFLERARAVAPTFTLTADNAAAVAEICCRLDGMPLAIELAAAWVGTFAPERILAQLGPQSRVLTSRQRGVSERQSTLWQAIDWSYRLLSEPQQTVLRRLSVFRGGFTLDAAEAVAGADAWDAVLDLRDRSLLTAREVLGEARYGMLETIREYAAGRLAEAGEESAAADAQLKWSLSAAGRLRELATAADPQAVWTALEYETANLQQALGHAAEAERCDALPLLAQALAALSERYAAAATGAMSAVDQVWSLLPRHRGEPWTGAVAAPCLYLVGLTGDTERVLRDSPAALALCDEAGDHKHGADVTSRAFWLATFLRRHEEALHWAHETEARLDDPVAQCWAAGAVRMYLSANGLHERAVALAQRLVEGMPDTPATVQQRCSALAGLCAAHLEAGDLPASRAAAEQLLALAAAAGPQMVPVQLVTGCTVPTPLALTGDPARALATAQAASKLLEQLTAGQGGNWLLQLVGQLNECGASESAVEVAERVLGRWGAEAAELRRRPWFCEVWAEALARTGRAIEAVEPVLVSLDQPLAWDELWLEAGAALFAAALVLDGLGEAEAARSAAGAALERLQQMPFRRQRAERWLRGQRAEAGTAALAVEAARAALRRHHG